MIEALIRTRLVQIHEAIKGPSEKTGTADGIYSSPKAPQADLENVIDGVQLLVNYLLFDVETTRRKTSTCAASWRTAHKPPETMRATSRRGNETVATALCSNQMCLADTTVRKDVHGRLNPGSQIQAKRDFQDYRISSANRATIKT